MHIDWFVFFAQIVNLLILVYLLKRFLFGRIIAAMDAREARIAASLSESERMKTEAREEAEAQRERTRQWHEQYEAMVRQAVEGVETDRRELMNRARADVDGIRQRWEEAVAREREAFLQHLRSETGRHICAVARKALGDLADVELERSIVAVFMRRLAALSEAEKASLQAAMGNGNGAGVAVRSAFDLAPEDRRGIQHALHECGMTGPGGISYEVQPNVVSGIELRAGGYKLAWSVGEYLEDLTEGLSVRLQAETQH